ncbi:MAG: trigger factor [Candidatus Bipolaricaulota bacterium]|nr:trigger factor [Candidatus Bipolaricaulota bacterium]
MTNNTQYEIATRDDTAATVRVAIPQQDVLQEIESIYAQYSNELNVPGFRKGRVPKSVLETRFGRDVFVLEAKDELERKHLPAALARLDLHPVSVPKVQEVSFDPEGGFVFQASFAVLPDVKLPPYRGLEVAVPPKRDVSEEDVTQALAEIQSQFGTLAEREGDTVSEGDIVRVREKGEEWDTRAEKENPVTSALVGRRVGDSVDIDVSLEDDAKHMKATVAVVGLRQVVLPAMDDELAKDAGFDTLAALRDDVRRRMVEARDERHRRAIETLLLDTLVEKTPLPLPEPFVLELVDEEVERVRSALERPGSSLSFARYLEQRATTEEDLRKEIRGSVERRLRRELVLGNVAEAEGVAISDAELEDMAKADAQGAGEDGLRFVARLKAEERWDDYRSAKVTERLLGILRESAVIAEKEE